ncbi:CBM96 family carbohydrate-binding protein [Vibrio sp. WXL210]|uniref:CBM96 family carbohydrate-binding protein n=1 Tax=Vibrio sp. WXL210 TaxID=3450709 RepID=UPI003EC92D0A
MKISRRRFLQGSAAVSGSCLAPLSLTLPSSAFAAEDGDYKALICLFLYGGNDSFNMVVPTTGANYQNYLASRPDIGLVESAMAAQSFVDDQGQTLKMNAAMPGIAQLIQDGVAAPVVNVGTLLEPTNKSNYSSVRRPANIGAHNKQQLAWQYSWNTSEYHPYGWAGLMMDILGDLSSPISEKLAFSSNELMTGSTRTALQVSSGGIKAMDAMGHSGVITTTFEDMVSSPYGSEFSREYLARLKGVVDFQQTLESIFDGYPVDTSIPDSSLGSQLRAVKQLMQASQDLGHSRQVFFVATGGYDTHRNQKGRHEGLLSGVDQAVTAFYQSLVAEGMADQAVLFTMSDFGRTIENNSNLGTDHGWGSNQLIVGGPVAGGKAYGRYPEFIRDGNDAIGNKFIPSTSSEQMAATLCKWFGLGDSGIDLIFPSLNPNNANAFPSRYLGILGDAGPQTSTVVVSEDSYVRSGTHADTNFGSDARLTVKLDNGAYERETLLKFDLATASISTAVLRLYVSYCNTAESRTVTLYRSDDISWSESTVTWNTKPAKGAAGNSFTVSPSQVGSWIDVDVTDLLAGSSGTVSLILAQTSAKNSKADHSYASKEDSVDLAPHIIVTA